VGGAQNGEKFAFGLSGGTWKRSNPFLGGNYWAVLIRPKLFWITDVAAAKGVPIRCPRLDDLGSYYRYRQCSEGYWLASRSASGDPFRLRSEATPLSDVAFADFDGNGVDDAFRSNRGAWYVLYAGDREWTKVSLSTIGVGSLRFGDFDGDGAADVLQSSSGVWSVSFATKGGKGFSGWLKVKSDSTRVDALRIGDFNGDGASDALRSTGGAWYVSFSPRTRPSPGYATQAIPRPGEPFPSGLWSDWAKVKDTDVNVTSLLVGDYDGDGADDVLRSTRGGWYVTYATTDGSSWGAERRQKTAPVEVDQVATGDFDGDGADDVFRATGGGWYVTHGTGDRSRWGASTRLRSSNVRQDALAFADVNGDRRTDAVFHTIVDI
jgi:hypothetical protein